MTTKVAEARKGHPAVWRTSGAIGRPSEFEVESESTTLLTWRVKVDTYGNCECRGDTEGRRCWRFYTRATCKHCDAVYAVLESERTSAERERRTLGKWAETHERKFRLEDLYE
jgi:hypothetical protein